MSPASLADRIKARGFWRTVLRPTRVDASRIVITRELVGVIREASVQLRGWDFPHVDYNALPHHEADSIGQDTEWQYFHELWRIYQSGQFLHLAGMRHDWDAPRQLSPLEHVEPNQKILGMGDALFRFTEITAFASAYVQRVLGGESVAVEVEVGNIAGRQLVIDHPSRASVGIPLIATSLAPYRASRVITDAMSKEEMARIARVDAMALFRLFGSNVSDTILEGWQKEMRGF